MHRNKPFYWLTVGFTAGCAIGAILTIWLPWTFIYACLGIEGLLFIGYVYYRLRHRRHPENPIYWLMVGLAAGYGFGLFSMLAWWTFALAGAGAWSTWLLLREGLWDLSPAETVADGLRGSFRSNPRRGAAVQDRVDYVARAMQAIRGALRFGDDLCTAPQHGRIVRRKHVADAGSERLLKDLSTVFSILGPEKKRRTY
jgi:hypothetical protein